VVGERESERDEKTFLTSTSTVSLYVFSDLPRPKKRG